MGLPIFQTDNKDLSLMQTRWKSELDPIIQNPLTDPLILTSVSLAPGVNVINHRLGRKPQGWFISDVNAAITLYRSQPFNDLTLTLTSSGVAIINLVVY